MSGINIYKNRLTLNYQGEFSEADPSLLGIAANFERDEILADQMSIGWTADAGIGLVTKGLTGGPTGAGAVEHVGAGPTIGYRPSNEFGVVLGMPLAFVNRDGNYPHAQRQALEFRPELSFSQKTDGDQAVLNFGAFAFLPVSTPDGAPPAIGGGLFVGFGGSFRGDTHTP